MSTPLKKNEGWDFESMFCPPKHRFSHNADDEFPASSNRRKSPPRFQCKKRKSANDLKMSPLPQSSNSSSSSNTSKSEGCNVKQEDINGKQENGHQEEDEDQFPIKFSLSQDYKSDASFTDYFPGDGENLMASPRGSPALGPTNSFGGYFAPSPLHVQGADTFDFEPNVGGGFPQPKLQMSPVSTPPRGGGVNKLGSDEGGGSSDDFLANAKLESPPTIKRPPAKDGNNMLPPPRLPLQLAASHSSSSSRNHNHHNYDHHEPISSLSPRQRQVEDVSPCRSSRGRHHHHHYNTGGPTQHLSPGQTIYNVASKSVGSPPSPYQSHQHRQSCSQPTSTPASPYHPYPWRPTSAHASHSTPQSLVSHHGREMNETSPEFNPPRTNLRGQSRSGYRETTITVNAPDSKGGGANNTGKQPKAENIDPITPSPHQIRQAVSDESASPVVAPTVHHPPVRQPGPGSGGWSDSLHMAPLPPYLQAPHQGGGGWGTGGQHPPALPLPSNAGYPSPHHQHASYYHSPYYHQHQHHSPHQRQHQQHQHQHHPSAVPDHATSNTNRSNEARPGPVCPDPNSSEAARWRKYHHLLHQFLLQFGHCNVPQGYGIGTHYEELHRWCNEQRAQYQLMCRNSNNNSSNNSGDDNSVVETSTMTPTRVRMLTSMGFVWGHPPSDFRPPPSAAAAASPGNAAISKPYSTWDKWMELLSEYRSQHGNIDVPLKYEPNPSLGTFVNRQRTEYRKMQSGKSCSMTPERVDDLNRLGFTWAVRESHTSWEDRFNELKVFRDENGHCNVPKIYNKNPSLGYWVNEQRFQYRRLLKKKPSYMTQDKIKALNGLEFKWSLRETNGSWENWLKELREYKDQHGDVDVPLKYRHNQALGAFVNRQRTEYRKLQQGLQTSLTQERIQNLNDLAFKWAIRVSRTPWETRLDELQKFKEQHGHCNVPSTYPKNQPLAYWVFKQRGQYRIWKKRDYVMPGEKKQMCHMTPERISKLDAIGFEWNPPRRIK